MLAITLHICFISLQGLVYNFWGKCQDFLLKNSGHGIFAKFYKGSLCWKEGAIDSWQVLSDNPCHNWEIVEHQSVVLVANFTLVVKANLRLSQFLCFYYILLFATFFQELEMKGKHRKFHKEWWMHLHVKHLDLSNRHHNVVVDYLVLMKINPLILQMKTDVNFSRKYLCLASIPDLSLGCCYPNTAFFCPWAHVKYYVIT